ncbi:MAG: ribonuclease H-like YkuK family protein [Candidatus Caldatribacteriaceae bacterium]
MHLEEVVKALFDFIHEEPRCEYRLIIGTDSKNFQENPPVQVFVTAVVVHRIGFGGRYFWRRTYIRESSNIRGKIYTEAWLSLQISQKLLELLRSYPDNHLSNYKIEIHVDIGTIGPTRELIREIVGMIENLGFVAKIKPESFGASRVAHRHT